MQVIAEDQTPWPRAEPPHGDKGDYIPFMIEAMAERNISLRALALKAGIYKSRLGLLLHREPTKRSLMTLTEFQRILAALGMDVIQATVTVEIMRVLGCDDLARHRQLITMLCAMFRDLPLHALQALEEVEGLDGTEARAEWAPVLQRAVIKRVVAEIGRVATRRAELIAFDLSG